MADSGTIGGAPSTLSLDTPPAAAVHWRHKESITSTSTSTSQTFLLVNRDESPNSSGGEDSRNTHQGGENGQAQPEKPAAAAAPSGKKRWNKVKSAIKFTSKAKPRGDDEGIKANPDVQYLLVSFLPPSVCFKDIHGTLERFVSIDKSTSSDSPFLKVRNVRRVPGLANFKSPDHGHKMEKGSILLELEPPEEEGQQGDADAPAVPEKHNLTVSLHFSTDPVFAYLCSPRKEHPSPPSEADVELYSTYERIFALNPRIIVMRQRCLTEQPYEVRAWTKPFSWAFPQRPEEGGAFVKLAKDDMNYLNSFIAQCLYHDTKRLLLATRHAQLPDEAPLKVVQIQPNGDWKLVRPEECQ